MASKDAVRAELAAAEAEAAEADAIAEAARAKAVAARSHDSDTPESADNPESPESADVPADPASPIRRPVLSWQTAGLAAAALLFGAAVTLTALMMWQHGEAAGQRGRDQHIVEAARAGVVALLSIDHTTAEADVQRVLDRSTGQFREDFAKTVDDWVKTAVDSKSVTLGSISAAALDSVKDDTGVVLVAASSQVTNTSGARDDPRPWRMSVTVNRDGEQWKMSSVEFVP